MINQHSAHPHHSLRHYVIIATLIVGGIFVLLLVNKDGDRFDLTTAMVSELSGGNGSEDISIAEEELWLESGSETERKINNPLSLILTFNQIPSIKKEVSVDEISLEFTDLTTKIKINDDRIELNNIEEVGLDIKEFSGTIIFNKESLSLDGLAKRIAVNGVTLSSSKEDLKISFDDLVYTYLDLTEVEMEELELPAGNGNLEMEEKLSYVLEDESLKLGSFKGDMILSREDEIVLGMEGLANGLTLRGSLLNLNLR